MRKPYAIANLVVIIAVIIWNYAANALGIRGNTVGSLSDQYDSLFTPAGYAFAIWGPIYLGLIAHGIFQVRSAFSPQRDDAFISRMGPWLMVANLANAGWIWFWLTEQTGISVILMGIILFSLILLIVRLNMERWNAPVRIVVWVWWPLSLYGGWIAVATIANVAAYLGKIGWEFLFSDVTWAVIMVIVATLLNFVLIINRNMREFAAVGVWALLAIAVRHRGEISSLAWTAMAGALLLFITAAIHGYRNRKTNSLFSKFST